MSRTTTRIFLGLALILAIAVSWFSFNAIKSPTDSAWATIAAALAVMTSVISAWSAQRIVEIEEDRLRPYPYPYFDTTSRYGFILLRVQNSGGGTAHGIQLVWDEPLVNSKAEEIHFSPGRASPEIPVLGPGQSISRIVDTQTQFCHMDKRHEYAGRVMFTDASGKKYKHRFVLDAEMFRRTPYYAEESLKTNHELQKLPAEIQKLVEEVHRIQELLSDRIQNDKEP